MTRTLVSIALAAAFAAAGVTVAVAIVLEQAIDLATPTRRIP
ncbi:hypothetical protein [Rhodococcus rhodnii]|uniref:Uncharacterized protein n=1 Tax=Rhodococcus rhodnii LMG 5362 TaxID=1273125 RepID=R7WV64_9NOCA|nr:hypothetical protein [Rhodococcus rhodnii]EOM77668.1 hypothetical protein Rrhod_0987 [Rhodococcus rhodnii LMG 5362]EOM78039.1 hypothetical protein Rrhod_0580 [Rhodococcus rhodnii LMG 5362]